MLYLHSFWRNVSICFPHCSTKFSMTLSFPELNVGVSKALRLFQCCPFTLINISSKYGVPLMLIVGWSTKCWKSRTIICLMSSGSSTISLGRRPSKRPATVYWGQFTRLSNGLFLNYLVTYILLSLLFSMKVQNVYWTAQDGSQVTWHSMFNMSLVSSDLCIFLYTMYS